MVTSDFKIALDAVSRSKWRSFLTMLGVIIGVASVVTIVSIGEGVKEQVSRQIEHLGPDLITVRSGVVSRNDTGSIDSLPLVNQLASAPLPESDAKVIADTNGVGTVVPMSYLASSPSSGSRKMQNALVFGTTEGIPRVLNQEVEYGEFFQKDEDKNVAVIGPRVAERLFGEVAPIGYSFKLRGQNFIVIGVTDEFETIAFAPDIDYNRAVFIPLAAAKKLTNNQTNIQQILVKPQDSTQTLAVVNNIEQRLLNAHSGQSDFAVLRQEDSRAVANGMLDLLTGLISGIAAISLLVGGIGIMNMMIVSVTERTQEIGIRKSVGATNQQILSQFLTESAVISFIGGIIGVLVSMLANFVLRVSTDLQPVITVPVMILAVLVALIVGMIFGAAPALKAARKDPIEALRQM